jgi:beta-ribofuranosylaminobenzene 5'-phosphate synthase
MNTMHHNPKQVLVSTSARIHMGFFDLNGQSGRRFGSIGLALDAPKTNVIIAKGEQVFNEIPLPAYIEKSKRLLVDYFQIDQPLRVSVQEVIPRHFGLGSGTQMALALGAGISRLFGLNLTAQEIARITNRGARSGIGIGTFEQGGLVVDGGRGANTQVPPILARHPFPADWRVILIFDDKHQGIHGAQELAAFRELPNATYASSTHNAHCLLMQALPALLEQDLTQFGQAISQLQTYTGRYFAPAQGGLYASHLVSEALALLNASGVSCFGQTSWGPTGFAIVENEAKARACVDQLMQGFDGTSLRFQTCRANNLGADIHVMA